MKRRQIVATVGGFVVVLAFVAFVTERSQRPRMSWADDWRDLGPFLAAMGWSYAMFAAIFLATLWGGSLLWRTFQQKSPEDRIDEPQDLFCHALAACGRG